jgi:hypothetical protein
MTENSAIFDTRHGAGSSHPHRRRAPWGADLPETQEPGKLTSNPEAIWGMSGYGLSIEMHRQLLLKQS